jgi:hypothetical protein
MGELCAQSEFEAPDILVIDRDFDHCLPASDFEYPNM